jgi:hypothetical protein
MSWLSRILQVQSVKDTIGAEVAPAIPLLEAMAANDIDAAVAVAKNYGDVKDFLAQAEAELTAAAGAFVQALPMDTPAEVRAKIVELAEALPALAIAKINAGFPAVIKALDDVIPEEAILKALRVIGAIP